MSFRVLGTGMYVPPRVVTNDDLSQFLETNDEWITQRVGVKERHISTNETAADMGAKAARAALENSGVAAEEIDLILAASVSGESISPSVSCMIQNLLGLSCMTMDINAACSAFDFLLETAAGFFHCCSFAPSPFRQMGIPYTTSVTASASSAIRILRFPRSLM